MANMKAYSDISGDAVELVGRIGGMRNADFAARFPGIKGRRYDAYSMMVGYVAGSREPLPLTRLVEYKSNPSRHACDARCRHATGKIMKCECSCGGKNHGKGARLCLAA